MIDRILLIDNADEYYTDLITFKKPVNKQEVLNVIENTKSKLSGEYTNEDIYQALDKCFGIVSIDWLGNVERFEY